jgi:hypothetical protein
VPGQPSAYDVARDALETLREKIDPPPDLSPIRRCWSPRTSEEILMPDQLPDPIKMVVKQAGDVRIHTFISAFTHDNIANATHIVESKNGLVLVDAQFLVPYARKFREYADGLGKPIERLYLSHRHPDHWFGSGAAFGDVPIHALPETATFIAEHGEDSLSDHWKLGDLAPDSIVVPKETVEPGECTIDGVRYVFDRVTETEVDFHLTIKLPELGCALPRTWSTAAPIST